MSYYDDGNLARQLTRPIPLQRPRELEAEKSDRRERLVREAAVRRQYKMAGRAHAKAVLRLTALFILVASAAALVETARRIHRERPGLARARAAERLEREKGGALANELAPGALEADA